MPVRLARGTFRDVRAAFRRLRVTVGGVGATFRTMGRHPGRKATSRLYIPAHAGGQPRRVAA